MRSDQPAMESCSPASRPRVFLLGLIEASTERMLLALLRAPLFGAAAVRAIRDLGEAREEEGLAVTLLTDAAFLRAAGARTEAWDALRRRMTILLLLPEGELLRAAPLLSLVDGLSFADREPGWSAERLQADIALAGHGYLALRAVLLRQVAEGGLRLAALESLSRTERNCLACLGLGLTNEQIARRLRRPSATVKAAVRSILAKLGLPNRTAAAVFARTQAWADQGRFEMARFRQVRVKAPGSPPSD